MESLDGQSLHQDREEHHRVGGLQDEPLLRAQAAGWGAPTAVMTLEELVASGVKRCVSLGAAGALQESLNIGDIVV